MVKAIIEIFLNKQTKEILLLKYLYGTIGTLTTWFGQGDLKKYTADEFKIKGWDFILQLVENLPAFDPQDKSELSQMNSAQWRKFHKMHKSINLNFYESGEICFTIFEKNKYGGGISKERIFLTLPVTSESFWEKLMEAFEKSD